MVELLLYIYSLDLSTLDVFRYRESNRVDKQLTLMKKIRVSWKLSVTRHSQDTLKNKVSQYRTYDRN